MWKRITIHSKEIIETYTKNKFEICDYNFSNLYLWSFGEETHYKIEDDILLIKSNYNGKYYYYMPLIKNENEESIKKLVEKIKSLETEKLPILYFSEYWKEKLDEYFSFTETRDFEDYIYSVKDLTMLKGKNYSKKKNRLNNFLRSYDFNYEKISSDNLEELISFQEKWFNEKDSTQKILINETKGIIELLRNFQHLNLFGGLLRVGGKIIAYTIAEKLNDDTVLIHIEKALVDYVGSYQAINLFFLKEECLNYKFVNREDDFGDEGLREAKLSYHPKFLLKKYALFMEE